MGIIDFFVVGYGFEVYIGNCGCWLSVFEGRRGGF